MFMFMLIKLFGVNTIMGGGARLKLDKLGGGGGGGRMS